MQVQDIMTKNPIYIAPGTTLKEAAEKIDALDCGFLAVGDDAQDRLKGVITDRDIAIRAVARGADPNTTRVDEVHTPQVLYCYAEDEVKAAADNMHDNQVYRLIVLNNAEEKRLAGVVTLGDIVRNDEARAAERAAKGISAEQLAA